MAGLNLEFHPDSYSLIEKDAKMAGGQNKPPTRVDERIYEVPFGRAGVLYVKTHEEWNAYAKEEFKGLFRKGRCLREEKMKMGGRVGAYRRPDGVLSIGTPYSAASDQLMYLGKLAAEAGDCFLRVDRDEHNELENQWREDLFEELWLLLGEHGVGIIEEGGKLFLASHSGHMDSTSRSFWIQQYMQDAFQRAVIPGRSQPYSTEAAFVLSGTAIEMDYADAFRQHFFKTVRGSGDFLKLAAETALGKWNAAIGNHDGGRIKLNPDN